jgi:uncharacterized alpha-E superfamily protein
MTTRIIDVRSTDLFPDDLLESRSLDTLQWISVLRSLNGYQAYRRQVAIRVNRADVLTFLFHDASFPRSFMHCLDAVDESVWGLGESEGTATRGIRRFKRKLLKINVGELNQASLHEFIDELQIEIGRLHAHLAKTFFPPPLELDETA